MVGCTKHQSEIGLKIADKYIFPRTTCKVIISQAKNMHSKVFMTAKLS